MSHRFKFIKGEFSDSSHFVPKSYVSRGVDSLGRWIWVNHRRYKVIRIYANYSYSRQVYYNVVKIYYY